MKSTSRMDYVGKAVIFVSHLTPRPFFAISVSVRAFLGQPESANVTTMPQRPNEATTSRAVVNSAGCQSLEHP